MSFKSAPRCSVSALAVAMMVMNASAASVDMGRVANGVDAEERYSAVDKAITWGYNGGRALQAGWCSVVSDSDTYCCGFGAQASCLARGLDYEGHETPCEVRLVTTEDGTTCEGLAGDSGNLEVDCGCEDLELTEAPATDAPSPTPTPTAAAPTEEGMTAPPTEGATPPPTEEGATPPPTEEGATPPPTEEGATPPPTEEGATPSPTEEGATPPPTEEGATPPPTEEGATPAPAEVVVSPALTPGNRDGNFTMAPLAEGETRAPAMM